MENNVLKSSLCSLWTSILESDVLNSVSRLSIMESTQNSTDNLQQIINRNKKVFVTENLNYLYQNGHRTTHQIRRFKASPDRYLRPFIAA